jgi:hypothetical protein
VADVEQDGVDGPHTATLTGSVSAAESVGKDRNSDR